MRVVALGGNALLKRGEPMTAGVQRRNIKVAAQAMAPIAQSHQLVISHGKRTSGWIAAEPGSLTTTIAQGMLKPCLRDMFIENINMTQPSDSGGPLSSTHKGAMMRKLLLGSTALAVALSTLEAHAADGVKLGIGGRYKGAAGVNAIQDFGDFDNTIDHPRTYVFKQDVEVYFLGETTLDNGLTVGARIELEGQTSSDQIDAVFAYFSGGFGEVRFGDTEEAYAQLCYLVPSASELFGADSPDFNFSNAGLLGYGATNGTCYGVDDKSTKLVYFSPNFAGFSFAASFTPDNTEDTRNTVGGAATRPDNNAGQNSENLSVAANFTHDFNDVNILLGGGATWSFDAENDGNPATARSEEARGYNAYAQFSYAGFTIGGAMEIRDNFATGGADQFVYGVGGTYNWDAWTIGLGWTHGDYELYGGPGDVTENHNIISLTASYALGPGITLDGVVEYDWQDFGGNGTAGNPDGYEGLAFGAGTLINF